jgi:hypothetical protein
LSESELYNPATGTWETTAEMNKPRGLHTATLLRNGQVLVTGGGYAVGSPAFVQASAELYGPAPAVAANPASEAVANPAPPAPPRPPSPLGAVAICLVILAACLVILAACVVLLLCAGVVFFLVQRWRK